MKKVIILDSIRSMQNVGAIMRNCDGAGFDSIFLCGHCPHPPRSDISKTALGAEKTIFWEYYSDIYSLVRELKKNGFSIYSVECHERSKNFKEVSCKNDEKICLVLGNEKTGVNEKILDISDHILEIPMLGKKESLNVSVAAGVVMYEFI